MQHSRQTHKLPQRAQSLKPKPEAGITFADAQAAFVPAADAMTIALNTLNDTITEINTGEKSAITDVDDTFAEVLETAGVPLTDALNNAVEPMDQVDGGT